MTDPLRVLFLIDSLKMGGAERITVSLMPYFTDIIPIVMTLYDHDSPLQDRLKQEFDHVRLINIGASRLLDPGAHLRFLQRLRQEKIDVIHAQLQHATVFAALARRLNGIPVAITRHVVHDDTTTGKRARLVQAEHTAIRHGVDVFVSVSQAALDVSAPAIGIPMDRCQVVYNGIDVNRFKLDSDKRALRDQLDLPQDSMLVTMVGVMRPGKGQTYAIEAFKSLPDVHLVLVGDGELADDLKAQAAGMDNVHFMGTRKDIPEILNASDVFILPSDIEALPTVLIEAGAAGLPVIASDVGGISEIIVDGTTGILIPPARPDMLAEKIRYLAENPQMADEMGDEAYRTIHSKFTVERQAQQLTDLYKQLAKRS